MAQIPLTNVANKAIIPTVVDEVVRTSSKVQVPPFGHKIIHGKTGLTLQGYKMNVMTHGLERRSPPIAIRKLTSSVVMLPSRREATEWQWPSVITLMIG